MTFQEARSIIYAAPGTHDSRTEQRAIQAVKYFEDNVLELEDYETDQLFTALNYIKAEGLINEKD